MESCPLSKFLNLVLLLTNMVESEIELNDRGKRKSVIFLFLFFKLVHRIIGIVDRKEGSPIVENREKLKKNYR